MEEEAKAPAKPAKPSTAAGTNRSTMAKGAAGGTKSTIHTS